MIEQKKKGRVVSEETKEKLRQANLGKVISDETKKKMSEASIGKKVSDETRKKQSEAKKGKYTGENHSHYGKKWWNDAKGNNKLSVECPGIEWRRGRVL